MIQRFQNNPAWAWIIAFILINMILIQKGNPNPASRLATLAAMSESRTFRIDDYVNGPLAWTNDWAKSPDGHYYSNKAPGPMLIGYPVFWAVDCWITRGLQNPEDRFRKRRQNLPVYNWFLSFVFQVLPFSWVVAKALSWLARTGCSRTALHFSAIAILFGNTASVLMNTYFGHGMAAWCLLGMAYFWRIKRFRLAGFLGGWAALSDYGAIIVMGVSLILTLVEQFERRKRCEDLVFGMALPLALGVFYSTICFGRPWLSAIQFENPAYLGSSTPYVASGMFRVLPRFSTFYGLTIGSSRGLLFTQPWLLFVFLSGLLSWTKTADQRSWSSVKEWSSFCFMALLWANCTFSGWHGGLMIGPRYLCILFPVFGWLASNVIDQAGPKGKYVLWLSLSVAVLLTALIYATSLFAPPEESLWPFLLWVFRHMPDSTPWLRLSFFMLVFGWAAWQSYQPEIR